MRRVAFLAMLAVLILQQAVTSLSAATLFSVIDLGTLGGSTSFALDVNNHRQVTGNAQEAASEPAPRLNAFSWNAPGPMSNLGVLAGSNNFSRGYAINDSGVIVGESDNNNSRAFVDSGGAMSGLLRLAGDNDRGVAHDVNNAGEIVGISSNGAVSRPTKWTSNGSSYVPADLGTIAGTASATGRAWAINQNGAAVGLSTNAAGTSQATLWNEAVVNLTSLGDGTRFSQAMGLNDAQVVVGSSSTGQTVGELIGSSSTTSITRAFVWQAGAITELSPLNLYTPANNGPTTNYHSVAMDINNAGLVVGNSQRTSGSPAVATLWEGGLPVDLNTLIPASSDIVGFGMFNGSSRAYLLTAVPEPSSLVMLGVAGVGMLGFGSRCRQARGKYVDGNGLSVSS
jgi:hypothetical protein